MNTVVYNNYLTEENFVMALTVMFLTQYFLMSPFPSWPDLFFLLSSMMISCGGRPLFFSNFSHDMANQDAILYHQTETKSMSHEFHVDPLIMQFRSWCYSINSDCHLGQQRIEWVCN